MTASPLIIPGPAGGLESQLSGIGPNTTRFAVLCHPHPQYGGSMNDAVLDVVEKVLSQRGIASLRFNFRGVGRSDASHHGNGGEADDVVAAVTWLREQHTPERLTVAGYSFGASMVWQALDRLGALDRVLLVAPPVALMHFASRLVDHPVDVFVGDEDQFTDTIALGEIPGIRTHVIVGTDHFFVGRWHDLEAELAATIAG
jgi:alpha/beta superfamily hydrolase